MNNLKRHFLLDPSVTFLNHGSFGATARPVFRKYQQWQRELENQPVEFLGRRFGVLMQEARAVLGKYVGTSADNLVFTTNATEAVNIVGRSLALGGGDEVLASDHEYGALDRMWRFLGREQGFTYRNQPIIPRKADGQNCTPQECADLFWQGVTPRTRVIFLSHITSPTAILLPVEEIIRRARARGILTVVDGAHAPGQIELNLDSLGADLYAGNLHKWLCAPKGAGFLYASPNAQKIMKPLIVSWGYEAEVPGVNSFIDQHEWTGTRDIAAFLSVPAAIEFQVLHHWDRVRVLCQQLVEEAQDRIGDLTGLACIPGVERKDISGEASLGEKRLQMGTARLPDGVDIAKLKVAIYDRYRIEVPLLSWQGKNLIRVSVQGYNTKRDIDALLIALGELGIGGGN